MGNVSSCACGIRMVLALFQIANFTMLARTPNLMEQRAA